MAGADSVEKIEDVERDSFGRIAFESILLLPSRVQRFHRCAGGAIVSRLVR